MKKQKTKKFLPILIVILIILASSAWVFQDQLTPTKASNSLKIQTKKISIPNPTVITYENRIKEAQKLIQHEYFSEATLELSEAIKLKPNYTEPYLLLGNIYLRENSTEKLNNLILKLEKTFPNDSEILILKTRKLINEKKFSEIMSSFENTKELPFELQFYKAVLLSLQNDHETSQEILKSLERLPIKTIDSQTKKEGNTNHKTEEAEKTIRRDFAKKVSDCRIVYEEFEEFKEGKNAHLFAKFAKTLIANNEIILAEAFADTSIKEDDQYIDAWVLRGYSRFLQKDYQNAIKDFRHAYELDPIRPEVHYFMALALIEEGYLDEAALFFEKALEYDFEFSEEVRWTLIDILAQQGKYDQVLELYKQLLNYETDPQKFASAVHTAIDIVNKPEVALEFTEILIENNPHDIFAINIYGWALIANNQYAQAEKVLNQAKKKDPSNPRTFLNLGLLYEERNDNIQAMKMYQKSYELGKGKKNLASLVNLAADKYNELTIKNRKTKKPTTTRLENSP